MLIVVSRVPPSPDTISVQCIRPHAMTLHWILNYYDNKQLCNESGYLHKHLHLICRTSFTIWHIFALILPLLLSLQQNFEGFRLQNILAALWRFEFIISLQLSLSIPLFDLSLVWSVLITKTPSIFILFQFSFHFSNVREGFWWSTKNIWVA